MLDKVSTRGVSIVLVMLERTKKNFINDLLDLVYENDREPIKKVMFLSTVSGHGLVFSWGLLQGRVKGDA